MDEVESYRIQYLEDIKKYASETGTSEQDSFLEKATKDMAALDACPQAEVCRYEGNGRRNRSLVVHGYACTDGDGGLGDSTLSLFVCDYSGEENPPRMTEREFNDHSRRCIAFVEEAMRGGIADAIDPMDAGYSLVRHIREGFSEYDRIFIYVVTDRVRSVRFKEIKSTSDLGGKPVFLRLIDMAYMKEALGSSRPDDYRVINVSDFGLSSIPCVKAGSNDRCTSYIGTIPGLFLALIYASYGSRLLESNVRSFLSVKTKVNRGIRNTIREDPGMFFAYNNGVALTASHVDIDASGIRSFTNLQIVNGGQTTVSLFKELKTKYRDKLYEVYVPMKLTVVSEEDAVDVVRNISVFVNTQNAVKESDLTSSTEFQMAMESASRRCEIPGSKEKWFYERTRGQFEQDSAKGTESDRAAFKATYDKRRRMDKIDMSRIRYMIDLQPDMASKGGQTCYSFFSRDISKVFAESPSEFGDEYFKESVAIAILYEDVYEAIGKEDWFDGYMKPQLCAYAVSKTLLDLRQRGRVVDVAEIWTRQIADLSLVRQALAAAKEFQTYLAEITKAGGNAMTVSRKRSCWESFSEKQVPFDDAVLSHCVTVEESKARSDAGDDRRRPEADDAVCALRSFGDWRKVKYAILRESGDRREVEVIDDVLAYLKDGSLIAPGRAKQALEIRRRYV
ncbi:MAG: AIPR family protein [Candidatus Methanomethylophilaceae archaeon]|nr:AIPR family protein [Candidatus Methanomethylophilaceae archaeon]